MKPITPREARIALGLSKQQAAELAKCGLSTWYVYEKANCWPAKEAARHVAVAALGCVEVDGEVYPKETADL